MHDLTRGNEVACVQGVHRQADGIGRAATLGQRIKSMQAGRAARRPWPLRFSAVPPARLRGQGPRWRRPVCPRVPFSRARSGQPEMNHIMAALG